MLKKEKITEEQKTTILANIQGVTDLEAMADVDLVVEAASENLEIKIKIFQTLDRVCKPETILASNTLFHLFDPYRARDQPSRKSDRHALFSIRCP